MIISENKKPYIDSTTMEKVFKDQEFSVVSMKIELTELGRVLEAKEDRIRRSEERIECFEEHLGEIEGGMRVLGKGVFAYVSKGMQEASIDIAIKRTKDNIALNADRIRLL
jgi:hypothetical protein